ncbi:MULTISPECIES: hypothetical protein [Thermoleptolyngbya]|uniref:Uncharacterized protein n=2 Tax=Thermoleptolyngbya TaxID=2303528 RepID=A0A6M8BIR3_9CYAN|nr:MULTISPECIES: hypothetical protein [Thermoleptolyngbya]MBF2083514.1 hypothetical protein [Thermoleptolyngbya sp. C42_A2020_037]QKD84336.1 hypothetical protein HPC62_21085 [Thermoleptolyngbya sichuanensis A183]WOB43025.1 hypothetical protein HNI00_07535 [Thermoleptolyngbya oregonensis NK1-22]HIK39533.1 hypothetical protein [Thermoleptolyngbya sp. M55_K2018_002]
MNLCPCCSEPLLRHARHNRVYWFCTHCWQEMPNLADVIQARQQVQLAAPVALSLRTNRVLQSV